MVSGIEQALDKELTISARGTEWRSCLKNDNGRVKTQRILETRNEHRNEEAT